MSENIGDGRCRRHMLLTNSVGTLFLVPYFSEEAIWPKTFSGITCTLNSKWYATKSDRLTVETALLVMTGVQDRCFRLNFSEVSYKRGCCKECIWTLSCSDKLKTSMITLVIFPYNCGITVSVYTDVNLIRLFSGTLLREFW